MEQLILNVDTILAGFVASAFGGLSTPAHNFWRLLFTVFIAFYGYKIIISGKFSAGDLLGHCLKIIVLFMLATQWDLFFMSFYRLTTEMPADIAGQIMGSISISTAPSDIGDANNALSSFFDRGMAVSAKILEGAKWSDIGLYLYAFGVWASTMALTGYAAMLIILSKLAVATLLAIAPVFILLLMFTQTKSLFEGWLRTLLNYAIIPLFVYTLLALLLTLAGGPLTHLESHSGLYDALMSAVAPYVLTSFISVLLLAQILNMAASITGGISLSTMGAAQLAGQRLLLAPAAKTGAASLRWGAQKSRPLRAYIGTKISSGTQGGLKAGKSLIHHNLQKRNEVR